MAKKESEKILVKKLIAHLPSKNIFEIFFSISQKYPNKPAVICQDTILTYNELLSIIDTISANLSLTGIKQGDIVAFQLP